MSSKRVAIQELASHYSEYPYVFRSVSGILVNFPEWFRNGSGIQFWWIFQNGSGMVPEAFHVSPEEIFDEDAIPSALSAKIGVALSVVLISYFGGGGI